MTKSQYRWVKNIMFRLCFGLFVFIENDRENSEADPGDFHRGVQTCVHIVIEANDFRPLEPDTLYERLKTKIRTREMFQRCL